VNNNNTVFFLRPFWLFLLVLKLTLLQNLHIFSSLNVFTWCFLLRTFLTPFVWKKSRPWPPFLGKRRRITFDWNIFKEKFDSIHTATSHFIFLLFVHCFQCLQFDLSILKSKYCNSQIPNKIKICFVANECQWIHRC
jgi:hypothetical protein